MDLLIAILAATAATWLATIAGAAAGALLPVPPRRVFLAVIADAGAIIAWAALAGLFAPGFAAALAQAGTMLGALAAATAVASGIAAVGLCRATLRRSQPGTAVLGRQVAVVMTAHHLPEGAALGLAVASGMGGDGHAALAAIAALAAHNVAEGALVAMPLRREGFGRWRAAAASRPRRAFSAGQWSGAAEVAGAVLGAVAGSLAAAALPWALLVAAGAMLAVLVGDLLPTLVAPARARA